LRRPQLRAYPKTDRGGDSGDFEFGQGAATTADQKIDPPRSRDAAQTQNPLVPPGFVNNMPSSASRMTGRISLQYALSFSPCIRHVLDETPPRAVLG
jgi:hypothetical protein